MHLDAGVPVRGQDGACGARAWRPDQHRRTQPGGIVVGQRHLMKVLVIGHLTGQDITPHLAAEGRLVAELRAEGPETSGSGPADLTCSEETTRS